MEETSEARLERMEKHLSEIAASTRQPSLLMRFIWGVVTGFGTVVGATLLISLVISLLKPLSGVQQFGPQFQRILDGLERQSVQTVEKVKNPRAGR